MKRTALVIIVLIVLLVIIVFVFYNYNKYDKICFENSCFVIEVADNYIEQKKGLMFRKNLCPDCGMLFVYKHEDNYKFWMKDTLISLDIIWMDKDFAIQYIVENSMPCENEECRLYRPSLEIRSKYVLEVNSGISKKIGLKVGEKMVLK